MTLLLNPTLHLEQIRTLHGEVSNMGGSLIERQDNIVKNIDDRFANFDRMAGNEYIRELHRMMPISGAMLKSAMRFSVRCRLMNAPRLLLSLKSNKRRVEILANPKPKLSPKERLAKVLKQNSNIPELAEFRDSNADWCSALVVYLGSTNG